MFSFFQFPLLRVLLIGVLCQNVLGPKDLFWARAAPVLVGVARQTLVKKVIWVGDSNLGKLEKELVIMMFCAGSLNTPQLRFPPPIPLSSSLKYSLSILKMFGPLLYFLGPGNIRGDVFCLQFTQNILLVLSSGKFMENICVEIIPPGIIHLMIAGFWPSCSWEPGPAASTHYYWAPTYNIHSQKMADS